MQLTEKDFSTCSKCAGTFVRIHEGKFPNGKDKKFIDDSGCQWNGRKCPHCVRKDAKANAAKKSAQKNSNL